jgi:uncharacterized protein with HEPN domain
MPSDTASAALRDIVHHIDLAVHFTTGFDYEAFVAAPRTVYAVTRCLEIVSEASRRLPGRLRANFVAARLADGQKARRPAIRGMSGYFSTVAREREFP